MSRLPPTGGVFQGKYRLDAILGEGGFARVYRATDVEIGREVAIKILTPSDPQGGFDRRAARFEREMQLVARLRGPHIAQLFDYGKTSEGLMYMVLELVGGEDLSAILERGPLSEDAAVRIMSQVLEALREAHQAGLLHRDVKPANIRVYEYMGDRHRAKLLDFGIAKAHDAGSAALTATGMVVGTPKYMAPEQLFGEPTGPWTDLYSLALVTHEMLGGRALEHVKALANGQSVAIGHDAPIRAPLREILNRMLARDSSARFQNAQEVLAALEQLVTIETGARTSTPIPAPPPVVHTRPPTAGVTITEAPVDPESARRRHAVQAIVAIVLATVALGVGLALTQREKRAPQTQPRVLTGGLVKTTPAQDPAPTPAAASSPAVEADVGSDAGVLADAGIGDGCGKPAPFVGTGPMSVQSSLQTTRWLAHLPAYYDATVRHPLVVLLHDDTSSAAKVFSDTDLPRTADKHAFVIISPNDEDLVGVWTQPDDLDRVEIAVVETLQHVCIDRERIWVVGQGSGSDGVDRLSCRDWVGGVAMASYIVPDTSPRCTPLRPKPALFFAPMKTGFQPPEGGKDCTGAHKISYAEFEGMWLERNECSPRKSSFFAHEGSKCWLYACGAAPFVTCRVDGGRQWPGAPRRVTDIFNCDGDATDFPQNEVLWKFIGSTRKTGATAD